MDQIDKIKSDNLLNSVDELGNDVAEISKMVETHKQILRLIEHRLGRLEKHIALTIPSNKPKDRLNETNDLIY